MVYDTVSQNVGQHVWLFLCTQQQKGLVHAHVMTINFNLTLHPALSVNATC